DMALFQARLVTAKPIARIIISNERFKNRLGGDHAAANRRVDALQAFAVKQRAGIANDHDAVGGQLRDRVPAADRHGLGAIADQLAAFEQVGDEWVSLELLKL